MSIATNLAQQTTFTYSPLVAYIAIAETKNSGRRKQKPTKIAIHHAAAKWTARQCADFFKYGGRYASANYCVGYNGEVALSVWEEWIPWTTSSTWCDSQAITIEVCNSATGGNWPVSDASIETVIQLCVYICKKYGIKNCSYTGDKNGVLQMHKWYTATGCPGAYLGGMFPYISREVNRRLGLQVDPPASGSFTIGERKVDAYTVKITATELNIRKSATTSSGIIGRFKLGDIAEITAESGDWGFVKDKSGWISLKWTEKAQPAIITRPDQVTYWIARNHLMMGSEGKLVEALQVFLVAKGATIKIDGKFGKETDAAVKDFQTKIGLMPDGIVGQGTWRKMFRG